MKTETRPWELCVCPICGRYRATSTGKNQLYCSGVGDQRHPGVIADRIRVRPDDVPGKVNLVLELDEARALVDKPTTDIEYLEAEESAWRKVEIAIKQVEGEDGGA